jgi:DNA polymerase (family 10)
MLQYFTGSKSHNIKLREYGLKKNLSLSEYGIRDIKSKKLHEFNNEKDFYNFLTLQYIPPEIREGTNEIELAKNSKLPDLVKLSDIKGDLHLHSSYNLQPSHDLGNNSFREILTKAKELNYEYVGFSEHNPKSSLTDKEVIKIMKKRKDQIEKINNAHCFIGLEVDIFPNGHIALPHEAIEYVDYLIVAVHSSFNLGVKEMTTRILEALNNPKVKILGHPTGRYFGKREGFQLEWEKIFEACKKNNIALEVNAWPKRLDLSDTEVREAINHGVKLIINTDAHDVNQMHNMFYGVSVARRGWAKKSDIMNTLSYKKFKEWLNCLS